MNDEEPKAWMVWCPKEHEFEYMVCANKEDAERDSINMIDRHIDNMKHDPSPEETVEIEAQYKPIPLYPLAEAAEKREAGK